MDEALGSDLAKVLTPEVVGALAAAERASAGKQASSARPANNASEGVVLREPMISPDKETRFHNPELRIDDVVKAVVIHGEAEVAANGAEGGKSHVLFVDDNEMNRLLGAILLEDAGYAVTTAADGLEAVEAVRRGGYSLIFMDIKMPKMDGVKATHAIRALPGNPAVPIIAVTANTMLEDSETYLRAGMNYHIAKPLDPYQILSSARAWTRERRSACAKAADAAQPASEEFDLIPLVSQTGLGRLRAVMPAASLKTIIGSYLAIDFMSGIAASAAARDFEALSEAAHMCKGISANIGAARLAAIASELENACRTKAIAEVSRLLSQMRATSELTRIALGSAARAL